MKSYTEYLWFNTAKHREYINITGEVEKVLHKSGVKEGMILVSAMHITAGVYVNDAESGLIQDIDLKYRAVLFSQKPLFLASGLSHERRIL